jgi:hypothetical protein
MQLPSQSCLSGGQAQLPDWQVAPKGAWHSESSQQLAIGMHELPHAFRSAGQPQIPAVQTAPGTAAQSASAQQLPSGMQDSPHAFCPIGQ